MHASQRPDYLNDLCTEPLHEEFGTKVWAAPRAGHRRPRLLCYLKSHTPVFIVKGGGKSLAPATFTTHCGDCGHTKTRSI